MEPKKLPAMLGSVCYLATKRGLQYEPLEASILFFSDKNFVHIVYEDKAEVQTVLTQWRKERQKSDTQPLTSLYKLRLVVWHRRLWCIASIGTKEEEFLNVIAVGFGYFLDRRVVQEALRNNVNEWFPFFGYNFRSLVPIPDTDLNTTT